MKQQRNKQMTAIYYVVEDVVMSDSANYIHDFDNVLFGAVNMFFLNETDANIAFDEMYRRIVKQNCGLGFANVWASYLIAYKGEVDKSCRIASVEDAKFYFTEFYPNDEFNYGGMRFDYFHNDADYIKHMISLGYDGVCTFANNTPVLVMFNAENVNFDTVYKSNMF